MAKQPAKLAHLLVASTSCTQSGPGQANRMLPNDPNGVDIAVSKQQFKRALAVMERMLTALENNGFKIGIKQGHTKPSRITVALRYDWEWQLRIRERCVRKDHVPTAAERADLKKGYEWAVPKWDMVPTGELVLDAGWNNEWKDGPNQIIEDCVDKALARIFQDAEEVRIRAEQEERERKEAEDARRRQELEAEQIEEMGLLGYLYRDMPVSEVPDGEKEDGGFYWRLYSGLYPDD